MCFPYPICGLLVALLLMAGRSAGQTVSDSLARMVRQYQPQPMTVAGTRVALGSCGTVYLPPQATQRRTGTKDSDRGEVQLPKLLISYDIGRMAGVHLSAYNRDGDRFPGGNPVPFSVYEVRLVGALQVTLGLRPSPAGTSTQVVATLQDPSQPPHEAARSVPANFWAQVYTPAELQQFLALVFSYQPVAKP